MADYNMRTIDKTIHCDGNVSAYTITSSDNTANDFVIAGDLTATFAAGRFFTVTGQDVGDNDGVYRVSSVSEAGGNTTIVYDPATKDLADALGGGWLSLNDNDGALVTDLRDGSTWNRAWPGPVDGADNDETVLQYVFDNDVTDTQHTLIKIDGTYTVTVGIDVDVATGDYTDNKYLCIVGWTKDAASEKAYGTYATFDAEARAIDVITVTAKDAVLFANIHCTNTDQAAGHDGFVSVAGGSDFAHIFRNCKASLCNDGMSFGQAIRTVIITDCVFDTNADRGLNHSGGNMLLVSNTIFKQASGVGYGAIFVWSASFFNCIFIGGHTGIYNNNDYGGFIVNCTFYGQTTRAVYTTNNEGLSEIYNCVIWLADTASDYAVDATNGGAKIDYVACNRATLAFKTNFNNLNPDNFTDLSGNVIADIWVDAASDDFTLVSTSPLLNTGRPTLDSGVTSIGAWQRKSYLGVR